VITLWGKKSIIAPNRPHMNMVKTGCLCMQIYNIDV